MDINQQVDEHGETLKEKWRRQKKEEVCQYLRRVTYKEIDIEEFN